SATRGLDRSLAMAEQLAGAIHQHAPGGRQLHGPRRPREQGKAQLGLQAPDVLAERRLADVQALRCAAEMQLLRDDQQRAQGTCEERHVSPGSRRRRARDQVGVGLNPPTTLYWTYESVSPTIVTSTRGDWRGIRQP